MAKVIEHKKYVCTDALNNNNKFWEYLLHDDGSVIVKYGRVGKTCTEDPAKQMSRTELDRKIREKVNGRGKEGTATYKPPYREIAVVAEAVALPSGPSLAKAVVHEAAVQQLAKKDTELSKLITRLVEANRHELIQASGGQMDIDLSTGIISTPVGVITKDGIKQARDVLNVLAPLVTKQDVDSKQFITGLNDYLMLVPQQVGHARGWHKQFFSSHNTLQRQNTLLDQLDASADLAESRMAAAKSSAVKTTLADTPNLFDAELTMVTDKDTITKIEQLFLKSINHSHESRNLRPVRFYEVKIGHADEAFKNDGAKMDNIWHLWHGTRVFNVLSILKNSLMLPKTIKNAAITGAMFGDGIYGSDQSTKALNYAYGYWDRGNRDKNCFMFLVDFAMGDYYVPKGAYETLPRRGHDSTFAKGKESGVMNNEMIVYRQSQVNPRYLIEFDEK